jgi:hypothetical protein
MDTIDSEVGRLQEQIRLERAGLAQIPAGQPGHNDALQRVWQATEALLDYEQRIPDLREAPLRRASLLVVVWCGRLLVAVAVGVVVAVAVGQVSWGWLLVIVPALAIGVLLGWGVDVTARHKVQRAWALALLGSGILAALIAFGQVSGWFTTAVLVVWVGAFFGWGNS